MIRNFRLWHGNLKRGLCLSWRIPRLVWENWCSDHTEGYSLTRAGVINLVRWVSGFWNQNASVSRSSRFAAYDGEMRNEPRFLIISSHSLQIGKIAENPQQNCRKVLSTFCSVNFTSLYGQPRLACWMLSLLFKVSDDFGHPSVSTSGSQAAETVGSRIS